MALTRGINKGIGRGIGGGEGGFVFTGHILVAGIAGKLAYSSGTGLEDKSGNWPGPPRGNGSQYMRGDDNGSGTVLMPFSHRVLKTTDGGDTWTEATSPDGSTPIGCIRYMHGNWYAFAEVEAGGDMMFRSTDAGATWTGDSDISFAHPQYSGCSWTDGATTVHISVGEGTGASSGSVYRSTNGTSWSAVSSSLNDTLQAVAALPGGAGAIAVGVGGTIYTSNAAGNSWTLRTPAASYTGDFLDIAINNAGDAMAIGTGSLQIQMSTDDGVTWTQGTLPASASDLFAIAYDETTALWVLAGNSSSTNRVWTSPDGVTWTSRSLSSPLANTLDYGSFTYDSANDRYILPGPAKGTGSGSNLNIQTSADGQTWANEDVSNLAGAPGIFGIDVNPATGVWVAVGSIGDIYVSNDNGDTWTKKTSGTVNTLWTVKFHSAMTNEWVIVGENGTTLHSADDGASWTLNTTVTGSPDLVDVACDGTVWVAVARGGSNAYTSTNGTSWTARAIGSTQSLYCIDVHRNPVAGTSNFVAAGENSNTPKLFTSPDGVTWTERTSPGTNRQWHCILFIPDNDVGNKASETGTFYMVCEDEDGAYTSPDGVTWTAVSPGTWLGQSFLDAGVLMNCMAYAKTSKNKSMFVVAQGQGNFTLAQKGGINDPQPVLGLFYYCAAAYTND